MIAEFVKTFVRVAESGSINRAAEALFLSPTAVKKHLDALEGDVGFSLFVRSRRGMALTEAGRALYADAKRLIGESAAALARARAIAEGGENAVFVGNSLLNPCKPLLALWDAAGKSRPDLRIRVVSFHDSVRELSEIYRDFGRRFDVMAGPCDIAGYSEHFRLLNLGAFRLCVGVPREHRLAGADRLGPADLHGERMIMLREGISATLDAVRRTLRRDHPSIRLEDSPSYYDIDVFNDCARQGILLLTLDVWADVHPALQTIPIDIDYAIPYGVLYPLSPSAAVRKFIDTIETQARSRREG